ncbi:hypothetical protein EON67_07630 [archaeon]|nr:MAG: hypothetical protein EON67_07630 [archaeon]
MQPLLRRHAAPRSRGRGCGRSVRLTEMRIQQLMPAYAQPAEAELGAAHEEANLMGVGEGAGAGGDGNDAAETAAAAHAASTPTSTPARRGVSTQERLHAGAHANVLALLHAVGIPWRAQDAIPLGQMAMLAYLDARCDDTLRAVRIACQTASALYTSALTAPHAEAHAEALASRTADLLPIATALVHRKANDALQLIQMTADGRVLPPALCTALADCFSARLQALYEANLPEELA